MEEEEDQNMKTPFWLQNNNGSNNNSNYRRAIRTRSTSFLFNTGFLIIVLLITAFAFIFFIIPSFQAFISQILRPSSVKKSWDLLNLILVLFAVVCGFLGRSSSSNDSNSDDYRFSKSLSRDFEKSNSSTPRQWYEYSSDLKMNHNNRSLSRLRSSSSYPDLRQESSNWIAAGEDRWRFHDDTQLYNYHYSTPDQLYHTNYRRSEEEEEEPRNQERRVEDESRKVEEITATEIGIERENQISEPLPDLQQSHSPPPSEPPLPPSPPPEMEVKKKTKTKRRHQDLAERETREIASEDDLRDNVFQPPVNTKPVHREKPANPPPAPPPPPVHDKKGRKNKKKRVGTTKEFLISLGRKKKKQRQKSVDNLQGFFDHEPSSSSSASLIPPPPPPPPPPFFQNLFSSKKEKTKKRSSTTEVQAPLESQQSKTRSNRVQVRPDYYPIDPDNGRQIDTINAGIDRGGLITSSTGNESPLFQIPPPPPPPPFKIPAWKYVVHGDYARLLSYNSSRSGSPDIDVDDDEEQDMKETGGDPPAISSLFCPSPDVDTKAGNFIARFKANLNLEKMNSANEKLGRVKSNLGPNPSPNPNPSPDGTRRRDIV